MANNNLVNLLDKSTISEQILLVHTTTDNYPLADFVLGQLKLKFKDHHKQYFSADRYFNFLVIKGIVNNLSLFSQANYIQINFKTKPNLEQQKQLITLLDELDKQTFIIIVCDKLNKTEQNTNWHKKINQHGLSFEINSSDVENIVKYILKQHNLSATHDGMDALINQNQGNMSQLLNEISKLTLAIPEGNIIGTDDIARLTNDNPQYNIYQLSNSYLSGNLKESIKILDNLYQESGDAILIMWMLQEDIKRLLKIKSRLRINNNIRQVMQEMRLWGESVNKLPIAEKRLKYTSLTALYQQLAYLDMSIKGVMQLDVRLLLVNIVKQLCLG